MALGWLELQRRSHVEFGTRIEAVTDWSAPPPTPTGTPSNWYAT